MILSLAMSIPSVVVGIWDVSRAHLHSQVRRNTLVRLPKDLGLVGTQKAEHEPGQLVRLLTCCYGLRDAAISFDSHLKNIFKDLGFSIGAHCPCLAFAEVPGRGGERLHLFRHGDDIVVPTSRQGVSWFHGALSKRLLVKLRGLLGPDPKRGDKKELSILNRLIRWRTGDVAQRPLAGIGFLQLQDHKGSCGGEQIEIEADPRHIQVAAASLGLQPGTSNGCRAHKPPCSDRPQ